MEIGFSGEGFANLLTIWGLLGVMLYIVVFIISRKRGIDTTSKKFQFRTIATIAFIFIFFPLLLSDLDILWKLIIILVSATAGTINFFVVHRIRKSLRDRYKKD